MYTLWTEGSISDSFFKHVKGLVQNLIVVQFFYLMAAFLCVKALAQLLVTEDLVLVPVITADTFCFVVRNL